MKVTVPAILGILAGILVTIGAFIPGWMVLVYPSTNYRVYLSLFYGLTCSSSCEVYSFREFYYRNGTNRIGLIEFQIEVLLSIVISSVSVVVLFVFLHGNKGDKCLLLSVILYVIGGLIILTASGRIFAETITANNRKSTKDSEFHYWFPYSIVPSGLGGVLQIIAAIIVYFIRRQFMREDEPNTIVFHKA